LGIFVLNFSSHLRVLCGLAIALAGSPHAMAQDEGDASGITTSAVLLREGGTTAAQSSAVQIGLRLGISDVEGVSFVHPVDALSAPPIGEELQNAFDSLDEIAEIVRSGDAHDGFARADRAVLVFEDNLIAVRRTQLVDAYMLAAVGRCRAGLERDCEERLRQVVAFRESLEYDAERYGEEASEVFDRARSRALSGARGTLIVHTEPEGAEVYIDGRSYGPSPVTAEGLLAGQHYVTVKELGYEKLIARADVRGGRPNEAHYSLEENARSRLVVSPEAQSAIRGELGEPRAGDSIRSLGNTLGTTQVIVGVLRPAAGGQVHVQLYLYHVHTRLLQAQAEATLTIDEAGMERARQVATDLYRGVDLSGGIEAPDDAPIGGTPEPPIWEQWWFWTAIAGGAVLIAGAIAAGVLLGGQENVPGGFVRAGGTLPVQSP
jgi:hypothetical protein